MWRSVIVTLTLVAGSLPAYAGWAGPWGEKPFWERESPRHTSSKPSKKSHVAKTDDEDALAPKSWKKKHKAVAQAAPKPAAKQEPQELVQGGPRPDIAPKAPETVAFHGNYPVGSIVIDTAARRLYYVKAGGQAFRYPIAVGKTGFTWTGTQPIARKQAWPDWVPPAEMRERKPNLPERMTGGINNPLGAMALYLGNSLYRIHGTSDSSSIGTASSSGCIRMHNAHVVHLASMAGVGTQVTVLKSLPSKIASAD